LLLSSLLRAHLCPRFHGRCRSYLGDADPKNPLASHLHGDLTALPPIRVHVGDDEVLLDESRRYVDRAVAAGVDATLDVWLGMALGFTNGVGRLQLNGIENEIR
jgi:epsilon-lactone hydrolase